MAKRKENHFIFISDGLCDERMRAKCQESGFFTPDPEASNPTSFVSRQGTSLIKSPSKDEITFVRIEFAPLPGCEFGKREVADSFTEKSETGVIDSGNHAADLTIFSFAQFEAEPSVDDVFAEADGRVALGEGRSVFEGFGATGKAAMAFDADASGTQFVERGVIWDAFDED